MHKKLLGLAVAMTALASIFTAAEAQETKTIGVSIPAADHGWTAGVVYHANRVAELLMKEHPGLNVIVKTSADPATQANAVQDLEIQGIDALRHPADRSGPAGQRDQGSEEQRPFRHDRRPCALGQRQLGA